jgi:hypothetical protein
MLAPSQLPRHSERSEESSINCAAHAK